MRIATGTRQQEVEGRWRNENSLLGLMAPLQEVIRSQMRVVCRSETRIETKMSSPGLLLIAARERSEPVLQRSEAERVDTERVAIESPRRTVAGTVGNPSAALRTESHSHVRACEKCETLV